MENKILTIKEMVEGGSYIFKGTTGEYDKNRLVANNLFQLVVTPQITCEYLGFNYADDGISALGRGYVFLIKNSEGWNDDGIVFYYDFSTTSMNLINQQKITSADGLGEILSEVLPDGFTLDPLYWRIILVPCDETTPNAVTNFKINSIYFNDGDTKYDFEDVTTSLTEGTEYIGIHIKQYTYFSPNMGFGWTGNISTNIVDSSESRDILTITDYNVNYPTYSEYSINSTVDRFFVIPRTYFETGTVYAHTISNCSDVEHITNLSFSAQFICNEYELNPSEAYSTLYDETNDVEITTLNSNLFSQLILNYIPSIDINCSNIKIIINYSKSE